MLLGHNIYHAEKKLAFLQIPKNASTIMRMWRNAEGWSDAYSRDLPEDTKFVVILRDPADRYLSAVNMLLEPDKSLFHHPIVFKTYMSTDQHFINQRHFCEHGLVLDRDNVDYFYFNSNVIKEITEEYNLDNNTSYYNKNKRKIVSEVNLDVMHEYYSMDYDLIDKVKFVNR